MTFLNIGSLIVFNGVLDLANVDRGISAILSIFVTVVFIRRLHDVGKSGWWVFLSFTIVGIIPLLIWSVRRGEPFPNRFDIGIKTPSAPTFSQPGAQTAIDQIERLHRLKAEGSITEDEFHALKANPVDVPISTGSILLAASSVTTAEAFDEVAAFVVILTIIVGLYFLPTVIAFARQHPNRWPILVVNTTFGATGFGWLGSLVWALHAVHRSSDGRNGGASGLNLYIDDVRRVDVLHNPLPTTELGRLKALFDAGAIDEVEYRSLRTRLLRI